MTVANGGRTYQLTALTDLWTGDLNGNPNRLITTGLLGSIRWWFEVLVRGLGGSACDPTDKKKCEDRNHCVVCELFGCTGWARKFRIEVLDTSGNIKTDQIKQKQTFSLRFTPLRPIREEEWALLDVTLRLIADYGAIGGKTVRKPSEQNSLKQHKDYGLMTFVESPKISIPRSVLQEYVLQDKWRKINHGEFDWASLDHFWCVNGKYLRRVDNNKSTFNQVLGRQEAKNQGQQLATRNDKIARWLAGSQQESKKVFSFKHPARTFGFVKPELIGFDTMKQRLTKAWGQNSWDFLTGDKIIDQLFPGKGDRS